MIALLLVLALQDFKAGFAEADITPPIGTPMQGANAPLRVETVTDPIFAKAAVFEAGGVVVGFVQLDLALVTAEDTASIRARIAKRGVKAERVMVCATHNHAGPAVIHEGLPRDEAWVATMVEKADDAFGRAMAAREAAEAGWGHANEWEVAFSRRIRMRDGSVRTHGSFSDPNALAFEGTIDPEVGVFAARSKADGRLLGAMVSFACHPAHFWAKKTISAGFPGVVARELKGKGVPVTLYLQGAAGDMHHQDPRGYPTKTMDEIGARLAAAAFTTIGKMKWSAPGKVDAKSTVLDLTFREPTSADLDGTMRGTQRFGEKGYYEKRLPALVEENRKKGVEKGEVQAIRIGAVAFAAQPSESFVQFGLRIKEETWPTKTFVVGYANGMVGYLPTIEGFKRGGYEATFGPPSCMAHDTGDRLADAAVALVKELMK